MHILGLSFGYHDAAAALLRDGELVDAVQEERFTRTKHDENFPVNAIKYCLNFAKIDIRQIDQFVLYESPSLKFERIMRTFFTHFPESLPFSIRVLPSWLFEKLWWKRNLAKELSSHFGLKIDKKIIFNSCHHRSHAASAFYPSPFDLWWEVYNQSQNNTRWIFDKWFKKTLLRAQPNPSQARAAP